MTRWPTVKFTAGIIAELLIAPLALIFETDIDVVAALAEPALRAPGAA
jgi:hypothetical protein